MVKKPTVISLFAGCGGSSLGYKLAGFKELLAVDRDDAAVQVFKLNFPGVPVFHGDVAKLTGAECMRLAGIRPGELDILDASPPCQGFSTSGKRKFTDPRNSLFKEFTRLLLELQPRVFVMENVTGMVKGCMKHAYLNIITELRACGYQCKGEVLNASHFNVPQNRKRVIIIGVRNDLGIEPSHPKPRTAPISVRVALAGLSIPEEERRFMFAAANKYAAYKHWDIIPPGKQLSDVLKNGAFDCSKQHPDRPAKTIRRTDGVIYMHGQMHWSEKRRFTLTEYRRIGSFPDEFIFPHGFSDVQLIGNSVPPNLMRAVAEQVRDSVLLTGKKAIREGRR